MAEQRSECLATNEETLMLRWCGVEDGVDVFVADDAVDEHRECLEVYDLQLDGFCGELVGAATILDLLAAEQQRLAIDQWRAEASAWDDDEGSLISDWFAAGDEGRRDLGWD